MEISASLIGPIVVLLPPLGMIVVGLLMTGKLTVRR